MAAFGFAVGDFVALGTLAWNLFRQCRDAPAEFHEVSNEINSLHTAFKELSDEAENEDSILGRADRADRAGKGKRREELSTIMRNCTVVLTQFQSIIGRYRSLGTDRRALLDRVRLDREAIRGIRTKLILHTSTLNQFMISLNSGSLGRLERGQEHIMDKIDEIALDVRVGIREPSLLLSIEEQSEPRREDAVWECFSRDILGGFSQDEIERNKTEIKAHIHSLIADGRLQTRSGSDWTSEPSAAFVVTTQSVDDAKHVESRPSSPQGRVSTQSSSPSHSSLSSGRSRELEGRMKASDLRHDLHIDSNSSLSQPKPTTHCRNRSFIHWNQYQPIPQPSRLL